MLSFLLISLLLATTGFASPHPMRSSSQVPVSALQAIIPSGQTQLTAPGTPPVFVAVGVGFQNYTCTAGGNYSSIGAAAQMFDISPLFGTSKFSTVQNDAFNIWSQESQDTDPLGSEFAACIGGQLGVSLLGFHDFVNINGKSTPNFDFTKTTGDPNNFVIAAKTGDIPSPTPGNVDWLELTKASGGLSNVVFRVDTVAGVPPSTCKPGSSVLTVKYAAQYYFC